VQESAAVLAATDLVGYEPVSFDLGMKMRVPAPVTGRSAELAYAPSAEPVRIRARRSSGL
jgi:hypothetical protein